MSKSELKYLRDKSFSDSVTRTKVSHGRIETAVSVRDAKNKKELDLEMKRLKILNEIDNSSLVDTLKIPSELKNYQQLILIIGSLKLRTTTEIMLAGKGLGYSGVLNPKRIKSALHCESFKKYFKYDKMVGWQLTNSGQNEFSRLKQFV